MSPTQSTINVRAVIVDEVLRRYPGFSVTRDSATASRSLRLVQVAKDSTTILVLVVLMKHGECGLRQLTVEESEFFSIQQRTLRPYQTNILYVSQQDAEVHFKWNL